MTRTGGRKAGKASGFKMMSNITRRSVMTGALALGLAGGAKPGSATMFDPGFMTIDELRNAMIYWLYQNNDHAVQMAESCKKQLLRKMGEPSRFSR